MRVVPSGQGCFLREERSPGASDTNRKIVARVSAALAVGVIACVLAAGFSGEAKAGDAESDSVAALRGYVQLISADQSSSTAVRDTVQATGQNIGQLSAPSGVGGDAFAALRAYVQRINDGPSQSAAAGPKLADADTAIDALREFFQRHNGTAPPEQPRPAPLIGPRTPTADLPPIEATRVGGKVCLGCHTNLSDTFSHTLMGRLITQGKLDCETCHGPGSAHVRANGCVACHGDGGITKRPGVPSLVGQDPQYLFAAMKAYITGQRKNAVMKPPVMGLNEAELKRLAVYYAQQIPARAQTPLIGDPAAGKGATAVCAGCHGDKGVSVSPAFPSLAGQDAQYLADTLKGYKDGSRTKVVACAACHGDGGISARAGMPSLVGLDAQYLVAAMKAYVSGQRKHAVMKALLVGVSEAEINGIALYYAQQKPAAAQTPAVGDAAAGKTASAVCTGCHVAQGTSPNPAWPGLAGQDARYLADATKAYKTGARGDETMKAVVATLDDHAIADIASYFASLAPTQPGPSSVQGTPAKRDPVVARNGLVTSLDERTIVNIAGYYASLNPAQAASVRVSSGRRAPMTVGPAVPFDGLSVGGIISFRPDDPGRTVEENNRICLNCHERGDRAYWQGSVHEERGVACTNCHTIMRSVSAQNQLKTAFQPDTCFQCHKDRRAQMFMSAHMPIREGKVVCSDCHNPHGSATEAMLRQDTVNDNCYTCHAEKRGPFLFEHTPVRENCLNCHDAHGSINEFSLKMPRPRLCFECHTIGHGETTGLNSNFSMGRACQNCHQMIHGSNSPSGGVLQR